MIGLERRDRDMCWNQSIGSFKDTLHSRSLAYKHCAQTLSHTHTHTLTHTVPQLLSMLVMGIMGYTRAGAHDKIAQAYKHAGGVASEASACMMQVVLHYAMCAVHITSLSLPMCTNPRACMRANAHTHHSSPLHLLQAIDNVRTVAAFNGQSRRHHIAPTQLFASHRTYVYPLDIYTCLYLTFAHSP